jgi:pimeloyl-ACP methyl ester carboxylesterase
VTKQSIVILHGWGSNPSRWIAIHDSLQALAKNMGDAIHIPLLPGFDGEEPQEARESAALIYKDRKEYDKARAHWEYILQYISSKDEAIQTLLSTLPKQKK